MSDAESLLTPQLQAWADQPPAIRVVTVDRKDIERFCIATRVDGAIHNDVAAARAAGHRDLVAPPLFFVTLRTGAYNQVPQSELHEEGTPQDDLPPIEFRQAMAGETDVDLIRPFVAGDQVTCSRRVTGLTEKVGRSGRLLLAAYEYHYADENDEPFVIERFTRIFR